MKLTDEELNIMASAYAENKYVHGSSGKQLTDVYAPLVENLLERGFITKEQRKKQRPILSTVWWFRPTMKGIQLVRGYNPTDMVRAFIRVGVSSLAVVWIYKWITSVGELPEFLSHRDPDIRTAARIRVEELVRDNGNKPDRS